MTSLPASSLVETVANKIKQMILSGSLVNILPGERELGHRLSVGRETIRKAPALLERDAWIAPPRIKLPRRILKTTEEETVKNIFCHPVQEKKEILGFLTPQPLKRLAQSVLAEIYTISKILEEDGISVRIFEVLAITRTRGLPSWLPNPNASAGYFTVPRSKPSSGSRRTASPALCAAPPTKAATFPIWTATGRPPRIMRRSTFGTRGTER